MLAVFWRQERPSALSSFSFSFYTVTHHVVFSFLFHRLIKNSSYIYCCSWGVQNFVNCVATGPLPMPLFGIWHWPATVAKLVFPATVTLVLDTAGQLMKS